MTDKVAEFDEDEHDPYLEHLAKLGRTEDDDLRISVHEGGHAIAARLLGQPLGGATVDPGPGYQGRVWGERHMEAFAEGRGDASDVREALAPVMPEPGEDRSAVFDVFGNVYAHCIELMAGRAAERMLLGDRDPEPPVDDLRQARQLAMLICTSEEAIATFIAHCDIAARDLLLPYGDVVMALSIALRIKRTLDGAEIDKLISDVQARKAQAAEHRRRKEWQRAVENAAKFTASLGTEQINPCGIGAWSSGAGMSVYDPDCVKTRMLRFAGAAGRLMKPSLCSDRFY
jgi:hypothetical protein